MNLEDLIPDGAFVGTSLILRRGDHFLYGMRPARQEEDRLVIELTGIGGAVEQEDPTFTAAVRREAQEETGCDVYLLHCPDTLVVHGPDQLQQVRLAGPERPAAVVFRMKPRRESSSCLGMGISFSRS